MFKPLADGAKAVCRFTVNGHEFTNNLWFTKPDYDANDLTVLGQLVDEYWGGTIVTQLSNQATYVRTKMYDMRSLDGETLVFNAHAATGGQSGEALSAADALCVTLYTADRGRSARGRVYIAGLGTDHYADGLYSAGMGTAMSGALTTLFGLVAAEGWTPVVASGQHNGVVLTSLQARPITLAYTRSLIPASQRRRSGRP